MAWVESASPSFRARHESADTGEASQVLDSLERTRDRLQTLFPRPVGELTVVVHGGQAGLWFTNPLLALAWISQAPAARRYLAGWVGQSELHVLAPTRLCQRAPNASGAREMLALAPAALFARRVIIENNPALRDAGALGRLLLELRWAWLVHGGAAWFVGQTDHARPAIARRLREGPRPSFPPGLRDGALLGGTVIDLLARERGEVAAARFVCRLPPQGARPALRRAFGGLGIVELEGEWRSHLARLARAG